MTEQHGPADGHRGRGKLDEGIFTGLTMNTPSMLATEAPLLIRFTIPVRALPGPTSMNLVTPDPIM